MADSSIALSKSATKSKNRAALKRSAAIANRRCSALRSVSATAPIDATSIKVKAIGERWPRYWICSIRLAASLVTGIVGHHRLVHRNKQISRLRLRLPLSRPSRLFDPDVDRQRLGAAAV